ncbi:hypothetical protein EV401DRAFT_2276098 [Pisolithus croceorrhizus]|nr:hypothetical protein EV401DRAFT_2276098 [Pisolithus croceorrhizus]
MASSVSESTYESQNDARLDQLHSKLQTLRGVTTDIYDDAERQNRMLDDTALTPSSPLLIFTKQNDTFSSLSASLSHSSRRVAHAFGLSSTGGVRQTRIIAYVVGGFLLLWMVWRVRGFWWGSAKDGV